MGSSIPKLVDCGAITPNEARKASLDLTFKSEVERRLIDRIGGEMAGFLRVGNLREDALVAADWCEERGDPKTADMLRRYHSGDLRWQEVVTFSLPVDSSKLGIAMAEAKENLSKLAKIGISAGEAGGAGRAFARVAREMGSAHNG